MKLRGKPPGSIVHMTITWHGRGYMDTGDIFESVSGGSMYETLDARRMNTRDGACRYRVEALKLDPRTDEREPDWFLTWDKR